MRFVRPGIASERDTISARRDLVGPAVWMLALGLAGAATVLDRGRILPEAEATAWPFLTLAAVVSGGLVGDRVGVFRFAARLLIPQRAPAPLAVASVLALTALISGVINLDVAVVVAMPVALHTAVRHELAAGRLAVATALTANATSFLLPSSNLTTLLILSRSPMPAWSYVAQSWLAWVLVTAITVCAFSVMIGRRPEVPDVGRAALPRTSTAQTVVDLVPLFMGASAIRALLGSAGVTLSGGFARTLVTGSLLAAVANNLPAAAAIRVEGSPARWAAVLALAVGPNLLVTGSVASLICRRLARNHETAFRVRTFTLLGILLLPAQMLVAAVGLHLTGALR